MVQQTDFVEDDLGTPTEADLNDCYGSKYLSAADLGDKKLRTRIAKIRKEAMRQQSGAERPKFVIYFTTLDKPMVLNATNKIALVEQLGNVPADWIGAEIGLYTENTQFAGKPVKGLRLRVLGPAKTAAKPAPAKTAKPAKSAKPADLEEGPWASWPDELGDPPPDFDQPAE
jgi:hypothetical protein